MLITATYHRPVGDYGDARAIEIEAEVFAADPQGFISETLVFWTDQTRAKLARLGFTPDELVGANEAIEDAYDCHRVRVAQQLGDQEFFDRRNAVTAA